MDNKLKIIETENAFIVTFGDTTGTFYKRNPLAEDDAKFYGEQLKREDEIKKELAAKGWAI